MEALKAGLRFWFFEHVILLPHSCVSISSLIYRVEMYHAERRSAQIEIKNVMCEGESAHEASNVIESSSGLCKWKAYQVKRLTFGCCTPNASGNSPSRSVLFDPKGIAILAAATVGAGRIGTATGLSEKGSCLPTASNRVQGTLSGTGLLAMNNRIRVPAKKEVESLRLVIAIAIREFFDIQMAVSRFTTDPSIYFRHRLEDTWAAGVVFLSNAMKALSYSLVNPFGVE